MPLSASRSTEDHDRRHRDEAPRRLRCERSLSLPIVGVSANFEADGDADQPKQLRLTVFLEDEDRLQLSSCGIGCYRPKWLSRFNTRRWMLFWLCWYCTIQGMLVNGLVPSVASTIERRFNFHTTALGRILPAYDVAYVLCCVPVSYFGDRHSKPLFLGIGLLVMSIGSFLFSMPHFVVDPYVYAQRQANMGWCNASLLDIANATMAVHGPVDDSAMCSEQQRDGLLQSVIYVLQKFQYEFIFFAAHLLHGIGATPLFTLGISFIDENVKPSLSSQYVGIFYTCVIIGPAAGFFLSATFLHFHTDFLSARQDTTYKQLYSFRIPEIDESDPEWIGAWWIGFLVAAVLSLFAVLPILSFPRLLPDALKWQTRRLKMDEQDKMASKAVVLLDDSEHATHVSVHNKEQALKLQLWSDIRNIPGALSHLFTNKTFVFLTLAAAADSLLITGFSGFMAKYLERQFNVRSSRANVLIGFILVPFAGLGTMTSGYIVKRLRMSCRCTLKFCIIMAVGSLLLSPMFFVYCKPALLIGVQSDYPNATTNLTMEGGYSLIAECNDHCACSASHFQPVCGIANGERSVYFSSCFAGCDGKYDRIKKSYSNCSCSDDGEVAAGWCQSKCSALSAFLILFAPICYFTFSIGVPALSVVLRIVNYSERSFALGMQWIAIRCFGNDLGTIPAPMLFGMLFEVSCVIRRPPERYCGGNSSSEGSCYVYDNKLLADLFLTFAILGQLITLMFLVAAWACCKAENEITDLNHAAVRRSAIMDDSTSDHLAVSHDFSMPSVA
ncbi:unnamed protein product [Soboliphyme baturini]|uniref:Solute carrier organic anion transporter family member n=1 Tax=Soboliphyme baturini TaxID=241478 RepID=A0A183IF62_9BILA|nr:unnamed protein product [Soboliphyme baturini]